ncbi:hypothetical protein BLNAU_19720 [Blattamonas nauphoetae]|uniref:Uncharacterized protein n=1 Tax=Blattamonas nauphoetae TaxID=2049346 RepID=A0ABQ9X2D3_9EUKA|nr:hypothetical protein BLNAU_20630 [Blattamonas nauphoetae]KAK2945331.1 hypothetical protein BLNAU_19720 [Blattamonas nauphoetae]
MSSRTTIRLTDSYLTKICFLIGVDAKPYRAMNRAKVHRTLFPTLGVEHRYHGMPHIIQYLRFLLTRILYALQSKVDPIYFRTDTFGLLQLRYLIDCTLDELNYNGSRDILSLLHNGVNSSMRAEDYYSEFETLTARDDANELIEDDWTGIEAVRSDRHRQLGGANEPIDLTADEIADELDSLL